MIQYLCKQCGHEFNGSISTFVCEKCSSTNIKKMSVQANPVNPTPESNPKREASTQSQSAPDYSTSPNVAPGNGGFGTIAVRLLAFLALAAGVLFLVTKWDAIFSDEQQKPFNIVIPKNQDIDTTFFVIQIEDVNGKTASYNSNVHKGIDFTVTVDGKSTELTAGNTIYPCLSSSNREKEVVLKWEITGEESNWHHDLTIEDRMTLYFTSNNDHQNADCYIVPTPKGYYQTDSCHIVVNMGVDYDMYKDQIFISIDGGVNYQKNNVFEFKNLDYSLDKKKVNIVAYFEGKEASTKREYEDNWNESTDDPYFDNCSYLYVPDPKVERRKVLQEDAISLGDWINQACPNWNNLSNDELEKCISEASELRYKDREIDELRVQAEKLNIDGSSNMTHEELVDAIKNKEIRIELEKNAKKYKVRFNQNTSNKELESLIETAKKQYNTSRNIQLRDTRKSDIMNAFNSLSNNPWGDATTFFSSTSYLRSTEFIYKENTIDVSQFIQQLQFMPDSEREQLSIIISSWGSNNSASSNYCRPVEIIIE